MNKFCGYGEEEEQVMQVFFRSLPEDHRRRYAAVEARKIGFGGYRTSLRYWGCREGRSIMGCGSWNR